MPVAMQPRLFIVVLPLESDRLVKVLRVVLLDLVAPRIKLDAPVEFPFLADQRNRRSQVIAVVEVDRFALQRQLRIQHVLHLLQRHLGVQVFPGRRVYAPLPEFCFYRLELLAFRLIELAPGGLLELLRQSSCGPGSGSLDADQRNKAVRFIDGVYLLVALLGIDQSVAVPAVERGLDFRDGLALRVVLLRLFGYSAPKGS